MVQHTTQWLFSLSLGTSLLTISVDIFSPFDSTACLWSRHCGTCSNLWIFNTIFLRFIFSFWLFHLNQFYWFIFCSISLNVGVCTSENLTYTQYTLSEQSWHIYIINCYLCTDNSQRDKCSPDHYVKTFDSITVPWVCPNKKKMAIFLPSS